MAIQNGKTADADEINAELSALAGDISTLDGAAVKKTGDQSIAGVKTFGSIPVLPASDPTTDNQAVRKAYVDATAMTQVRGGKSSRSWGDADGTEQTIAHGLGKIPKVVRVYAYIRRYSSPSYISGISTGILAVANSFQHSRWLLSGSYASLASGYIIYAPLTVVNSWDNIKASVSVNATNLVFSWSRSGSGYSDAVEFFWEAIA